MRYFLVILLFSLVVVASLAGFRGDRSRRPPIEMFSDMVRQPKLRPQSPNDFFADRRGSRPPPAGTVSLESTAADMPLNTGQTTGTTNYLVTSPLPVNAELLDRGKARYQIYCRPCHGALGDGKGITSKYRLIGAAVFHDPRLVRMPDGELFHTITYGKNLMPAYGPLVAATDRWAIIAYLRALQRSRLGTLEDVPIEFRPSLR